MRKLVLGMMVAGVLLPGLASAQDGDRRPDDQHRGEHRGDRSPGGDQRGPGPGAPRPPQQQGLPQPPAQQQPRGPQYGGGNRPDRGERPGDGRYFRPQPGGPDGARDPGGRDRFGPGGPGSDRRFDQPGFGNPGPNGRGPGGPPIAPGSGGYRPQPGQYGYGRPGYGQPGFDRGRPGEPGFRPAPLPPGRGGGWNQSWRDDRRYDFRQYRTQNNYIFRLPRYQAPRGWGGGYRRFTPGISLSAVLFDQGYWIQDPFYYRLPPAYGPYRWVRYYNDALLIDLRSGLVVDTVYDLFW